LPLSLLESLHRVRDPQILDDTVEEVFSLVCSGVCNRTLEVPGSDEETLMAVVGFGGILSGACILRCGLKAALTIAGRMMNSSFSNLDATVQDALGEFCNMLSGGWKGRIPELSTDCRVSVPAIITGRDYRIHVHTPQFELSHTYRFEDVLFEVTIVCEGLQ
jgi:chemotaxis protein CheX